MNDHDSADSSHDSVQARTPPVVMAAAPMTVSPEQPGWLLMQQTMGNRALSQAMAAAEDGEPLDPGLMRFMESAFAADFGSVRVHPESSLPESRNARALTIGEDVHFARGAFEPETDDGKRLIAHELAHVSQQKGETAERGSTQRGDAAEREAAAAAVAALAGEQPVVSPYGRGEARDEPGKENAGQAPPQPEPEQKGPIVRPKEAISSMEVSLMGIIFKPQGNVRYNAGLRGPQAMAIVLHRLIPGAYRPDMAEDWWRKLDAKMASLKIPTPQEMTTEAAQDDKVPILNVPRGAAWTMVEMLEEAKFSVDLSDNQKELLRLGESIGVMFLGVKNPDLGAESGRLPQWYDEPLFIAQMGQRASLLRRYDDAARAFMKDQSDANRLAIQEVLKETVDSLNRTALIWESIDTDDFFWENEETAMLCEAIRTNVGTMNPFMSWLGTQPNLVEEALKEGFSSERTARLELLRRYGRFMMRLTEVMAPEGDQKLTNSPGRANKPPIPSLMSRYPSAEPPLFDAAISSTYTFKMTLNFPDIYEALGDAFGQILYVWEQIRIPDEAFAKWAEQDRERDRARGIHEDPDAEKPASKQPAVVQETADDFAKIGTAGERVGVKGEIPEGASFDQPSVAGAAFKRAWQYAEADAGRAMDNMRDDLGPASVGAATLIGANNILRFVGTAIKEVIRAMFKEPSEEAFVFDEEGVYIIRCRAFRNLEGDEEVVRAPSVAYIPVFARDPVQMAERRARLAAAKEDATRAQLTRLQDQLAKDPTNDELRRQITAIERNMGPVQGMLENNQTELGKALDAKNAELKEAIKANDHVRGRQLQEEIKSLEKQLEQLRKVLEVRGKRPELTAPGAKPERLLGNFVGDQGQTIALVLDAVSQSSDSGKFTYFISDSTTPKSGSGTGTALTRHQAILNALTGILEGVGGYGRGTVSVWIDGKLHTLRIEASLGSLAMEAIDSLTLVASVIVIAAAPFTGGASLALLVPIGVVGAIPSAYRMIRRAEMGTFEWCDMETAMDIVNIAGAVAGVLQMATASTRFVRIGRAVAIFNKTADIGGVIMIPVGMIDQLGQIDPGLPQSVRRAQAAEIIGMGLVNVGIMIGGHMVSQSARVTGGNHTSAVRNAASSGERVTHTAADAAPGMGTGGDTARRTGAGEAGGTAGHIQPGETGGGVRTGESGGATTATRPGESTTTGGETKQPRSEERERGGGEPKPPTAARGTPEKGGAMTLSDLRRFFFRALRRIPMAHDAHVELEVDPVTYDQAWKNARGQGDPPPGFVDPDSGRIWILVGKNDTLLVFHEAIHQYAMGSGARDRFVERFGHFFEEAITEWITRRHLGPQAHANSYDPHVLFLERLIAARGVRPETIEAAYLDGAMGPLRAEIQASFGGDPLLTDRFFDAIRDIGMDRQNTKALNDAEYMLQTGMEPPDPTVKTPAPDDTTTRTRVDEEPTQVTERPDEETTQRNQVADEATKPTEPDAETTQRIPMTEQNPRDWQDRPGSAGVGADSRQRAQRPGVAPRGGSKPGAGTQKTPVDRARSIFEVGMKQVAAGNHSRAIVSLERVRQHPGASTSLKAEAIFQIGDANLKLQRNNTAVFYFETYLKQPGADVVAGMEGLNKARKAAGIAESALKGPAEAPPSGVPAVSEAQMQQMMKRAAEHYERKDYGEAIALFEQLRQTPGVPEEVRAHIIYNIGLINLRAGRFNTAIFYFERYLAGPHGDSARGREGLNAARKYAGLPADPDATGQIEYGGANRQQAQPGQAEPPRSGDDWDDITKPNIKVPVQETSPQAGGPAERTRPTVTEEPGGWLGKWKGDTRARVLIEERPGYLRIIDIYRGGQPGGSAGEMVMDVLLEAHGRGMAIPDRIRISNLQPEPSQAAYRAGGAAAEDPVFRSTVETIQRRLGRTATSVVYVHEAGAISIDIIFGARPPAGSSSPPAGGRPGPTEGAREAGAGAHQGGDSSVARDQAQTKAADATVKTTAPASPKAGEGPLGQADVASIMASKGWSEHIDSIGPDSPAAKALEARRVQVVEWLRGELGVTEAEVRRTGSARPRSDLDLNFTGTNAETNILRAKAMLVERFGMRWGQVELLLDIHLLAEPARAHIYTDPRLPRAARKRIEGELEATARMRYLEALATRAEQTPEVKAEIERAALEWGIDAKEVQARPPLSEEALNAIRTTLDELHTEFDRAPSEDLARDIVHLSIELNMRNPEALYDPASIRERASKEMGKGGGPLSIGEAYADLLGQRAELFRKIGDVESEFQETVKAAGETRGEARGRVLRAAAERYDISKNAWRFMELADRAGMRFDLELTRLAFRVYDAKSIDGIITGPRELETYIRTVLEMQEIIIREMEASMKAPGRSAREVRFNMRQRLDPVVKAIEPLAEAIRAAGIEMDGVMVHTALRNQLAMYEREQGGEQPDQEADAEEPRVPATAGAR